MGAEKAEPGGEQAVKAACHRVLWDVRTFDADETRELLAELDEHVRALSPQVTALVPELAGETRETAFVVLRNVDRVLYPDAPSADWQLRLHDLAVLARALCELRALGRRRVRGERRPADSVDEPADPSGWLAAGAGA
ncbi:MULTISPECIES: hypothetical protein [Streptomyces]|uniref:Restriction endonuclease n=1 Tax=Streptomyces canarius TaxID=285453 RepID=A0ABQ3CF33_9ACTN|nr:hypothetical protein [Streptomyces canarius]GHA09291.1 hypothetical protein GCM10010345_12200 [Streptomyces canarius]